MFPEGTKIEYLSRALLEFYPRIEGKIEDIKECVDICVRRGFYEKCAEGQMRLYIKILRYNSRKYTLRQMKDLVEVTLDELPLSSREILRDRYLFQKDINYLQIRFHISLRTLFRHIDRAIHLFSLKLLEIGFDEERLFDYFGMESEFTAALRRVLKRKDKYENRRKR